MDFERGHPWVGRWKLASETGFVDWLVARGLTPAEAAAEVDTVRHHTTLTIAATHERVELVWSTNIRGRLRRQKSSLSYSLDGRSPTTTETRFGLLSATASVQGDVLVHRVTGPLGLETHERKIVDGHLQQTMMTDDSSLPRGTRCELMWRPSR